MVVKVRSGVLSGYSNSFNLSGLGTFQSLPSAHRHSTNNAGISTDLADRDQQTKTGSRTLDRLIWPSET